MPRIAAFVSPHGFGHAARASGVLAEVGRRADARFDLFTTAPRWFFDESLAGLFDWHERVVDVGFRQASALVMDLPATVEALVGLVPFDPAMVGDLAREVEAAGCSVVLADIAPLGVAVAEAAGLPSVLVENFSWPWLYEAHFEEAPALEGISRTLDEWSRRATVHVQTRPLCARIPGTELVDPISREARATRDQTRRALGIPGGTPLVVVTMGGYGEEMAFLDRLAGLDDLTFLVTGASSTGVRGNLHLFDNATPIFMPDVLRAADAVVAKLGYGMVAEVWREGLPLAWVTRSDSREMPPLEAFAADELSGFLLTTEEFRAGAWVERIPDLLRLPRRPRPHGGGAGRVAEILLELAGA